MLVTCISTSSGTVMPRRQPRRPSMGLTSAIFSTMAVTASGVRPGATEWAKLASMSSAGGRNSCKGGSRRRTVTGRPSMASSMPSKSARWKGSSSASALALLTSSGARIMRRTTLMRSAEKNMCSVRANPMPCAPFLRASKASAGVSALVRTLILLLRLSSTHCMKRRISPELSDGGFRAILPTNTSPVSPLRLMKSPTCKHQ